MLIWPVLIYTEITPNPQSLKFILPPQVRALERGNRTYDQSSGASSDIPEGVKALLEIAGVESVFLTPAFITITKKPEAAWHEIIPAVKEILKKHLPNGPLAPAPIETTLEVSSASIESQILEVIENYIRPAIAMDGGDVEYVGYSEGVVRLRLMGSCVGCPSSILTLKAGIENLLTRLVPEVKAVEAE